MTTASKFDDIDSTISWLKSLDHLPINLRTQIIKESLGFCENEECLRQLKGALSLLSDEQNKFPIKERLASDVNLLWKVRPYFFICTCIALIYIVVKAGIHLGHLVL